MELDDVGPQTLCRLNGRGVRLDEERHTDARVTQSLHVSRKMIVSPDYIEAALGGAFLAFLRNQAARMRHMPQRDAEHFLGGGHLEIERSRQLAFEPGNIIVGNVPAILTKMRGDPVGTGCNS